MSPFQLTYLLIFMISSFHSQSNDYNQFNTSRDADGTYRWQSITPFIPIQSASFGSIPLGDLMKIEFDFIWWGRTNDPRLNKFEMFFRVGFDASASKSCAGQGARYPSFWLTGNVNTMHVSVSSGTQCQLPHSLNAYGIITIGVMYHVSIAFNSSEIVVLVSGGNKADWNETWSREATPSEYIGAIVPVWWMSNKHPDDPPDYNRGNATFTNVVLTSFTATPEPTTSSPTTQSPTSPSSAPSSTPTTAIPTSANPTITPTINPSLHPTTDAPSTRAPTTSAPSVSPTRLPSISPTTETPTNIPTANPSHTSKTPSEYPTNSRTTSTEPTISPVTDAPTFTGQTYEPTTQPTSIPTNVPSNIPTAGPTLEPTTNPSDLPTASPTDKPSNPQTTIESTYVAPTLTSTSVNLELYTTSTQYIANTIEVINPIESDEELTRRDAYEYVEITIFATVIALCFCTVISFLAYLTFKRRVREMQKKRKASPKYHVEVASAELPSQLELNGDSQSRSSNAETGENGGNLDHNDRNFLQSPLSKSFRKALSKSLTEEHDANALDSVYLSLGQQYKSDSAPHSHLSISMMNMKDATPTPAVSPNENTSRRITSPMNHKQVALVMSHNKDAHDLTPEPVRETVGATASADDEDDNIANAEIDVNEDTYDSEEDQKGYFDPQQAITRRKDNKHYAAIQRAENKGHRIEIEEPYEQELDGYGIGLYTTPIVRNYGPYRKNTENTEGYDSDNSAEQTDFYNSYSSGKRGKRKRKNGQAIHAAHGKGGNGGYEWIKKTLTRVDSQNYDAYMDNFRKHKVADDRLGDLLADDWKELIPVIGPRNEFRRLWHKYNSNLLFKTNGELLEDEHEEIHVTVPGSGDLSIDLGNDLLTQLITNNEEALAMNEMKHQQNENEIHLANDTFYSDKDVAKLTFDDIKNKFGSKSESKSNKNENSMISSVLSSIISNSEDEERKKSVISTESMEISQSYEESQSNLSEEENRFKKKKAKSKKNNKPNPIPAAIAEDEEIEENELKRDKDRLKPDTFISPPISPPKYTSHKQYDNPIIGKGANPSTSSVSSQQSLMSYSSVSEAPTPDDADPQELETPLNEESSDSEDDTLRIPKFHADVSDSDSSSDTETETESDETKSQTEEQEEFGQEVDVTIENVYDDDDTDDTEYQSNDTENQSNDTESIDEIDDDGSVSLDMEKSDEDEDDSGDD